MSEEKILVEDVVLRSGVVEPPHPTLRFCHSILLSHRYGHSVCVRWLASQMCCPPHLAEGRGRGAECCAWRPVYRVVRLHGTARIIDIAELHGHSTRWRRGALEQPRILGLRRQNWQISTESGGHASNDVYVGLSCTAAGSASA